PVLFGRSQRQHCDPARRVGAVEVRPRHLSPFTFRQHRCATSPSLPRAPIVDAYQESESMPFASVFAFLMAVVTWALAPGAARAEAVDRVSWGRNGGAEAENGGFYQALADGTYRQYGLDVTIVPGGPQINNRILLPVGKIDFLMSANSLQSFDAVEQNVPTLAIAAMFQKDPQVLIARPDVKSFDELKRLTLFISKEGIASYFQWLKADH